jgi:hypothetical protein
MFMGWDWPAPPCCDGAGRRRRGGRPLGVQAHRAGPGGGAGATGTLGGTGRAAGHHRAHQRPGRGAPAGRRAPGRARAPQRVLGGASALGASGAKSDPGDSYKLADYLRTDGHRLRRLREDHLRARPRPATSSAPCWRRTGPGPRPCAPGWRRRSRSPSWPTTRPPRPPPGSARPHGQPAAATATAAASRPRRCWPGCARPTAPVGIPPATWPPWSAPRFSCCDPAWDRRRARRGDRHPRRCLSPRPAAGRGRAGPSGSPAPTRPPPNAAPRRHQGPGQDQRV